MFGFGKKEEKGPTGAKEKIQRAMELRASGGDKLRTGHKGKEQDDTIPIMVAVYGFACTTVFLLMQNKDGPPFRLPDPDLHRLLLGVPPPSFMGNPDFDTVIAVLIRGAAIFLLAGLVPGIVRLIYLFKKGKKPPLSVFWLVLSLIVAIAALIMKMN